MCIIDPLWNGVHESVQMAALCDVYPPSGLEKPRPVGKAGTVRPAEIRHAQTGTVRLCHQGLSGPAAHARGGAFPARKRSPGASLLAQMLGHSRGFLWPCLGHASGLDLTEENGSDLSRDCRSGSHTYITR